MDTPNTTAPSVECRALFAGIGRWLVAGERGISSEYMASVALTGEVQRARWSDPTPSDAPDLGRCVLLVDAVPEIRGTFNVLRLASKVWNIYVEHWDELAALWRLGDYHTITARMKALRAEANAIEHPTADAAAGSHTQPTN